MAASDAVITATCAGYPASAGHEATDASTFAEWGVDYLKVRYQQIITGFMSHHHLETSR